MSSSVFIDGDPDGDASRPRSGILTPTSDGSLNRQDVDPSSALRQKREDDVAAMDQLLKASVAVKPHPHDLHVQPRTLLPLLLLPRQHLPLSCLDTHAPQSDLPPSRFYESHVKILDLESRMGSTQSVMVARSDATGLLYAIERQSTGLYVICRLGAWVEIEQLARRATAICRSRVFPVKPELRQDDNSPTLTTPQLHKEHKRKRAAIEAIQSLVKKRAKPPVIPRDDNSGANSPNISLVEPGQTTTPTQPQAHAEQNPGEKPGDVGEEVEAPLNSQLADPTPRDVAAGIFDNIRAQYSEALYKSKGSLAYFAKGPLSRARSAFHLDLEANLDMAELIEFLKSLILTTVQIDKKYRESAPEIISKMTKVIESSDETNHKRRKTRKMKLGKGGLYPREDEVIQKWWTNNKPELLEDQTTFSPTQIKSHLSLLRTRETQLQMILILEILALEPLRTSDEVEDGGLPLLPGESETTSQMAPPSTKKRNKHNLPVLVDVHADRLTIWQSTATDELLLLEDSQATVVSADGQTQQKSSSEPLKDFCVDVIVPFFSARLPQLCDSINRKLGGPVIVSPPKARTSKRSSSKRDQKPGAATKRPTPLNPQRTLQRALSVDQNHRRSVSRGPSNMIALMRSATSTTVSGLKREGSEPAALRSIPKGEPDPSKVKRSSLMRSSSSASLDDTKAKKKALVEAQLKDAISGLRKPNREVVGRALEEAAEQRMANGMAKKVKKSYRSSMPSIQVKATPANNRFKDVFNVKAELGAETPLSNREDVIPPSSIGTWVPSTSSRHGFRNVVPSTSPAADMVGSTPTKPAASFLRRPSNEGPLIPPSPLFKNARRASGQDALAANNSTNHSLVPRSHVDIFATPAKKTAPRLLISESPIAQKQEASKSIYQQLGWDDELDDL